MFAYYGIVLGPKMIPMMVMALVVLYVRYIKTVVLGLFILFATTMLSMKKEYILSVLRSSKDKGFVEGCKKALGNNLLIQQWAEEADHNDPLVSLHNDNYKAFNYYQLPDGQNCWFVEDRFDIYRVPIKEKPGCTTRCVRPVS